MKKKSSFRFLAGMKGSASLFRIISVLIVLIIFGSGGSVLAQDILILKSGKELKVNVVEENESLVKYREFENPDGPLYQVAKDKVASIKYKKGLPPQAAKPEAALAAAAVAPPQENSSQLLTAKRRYVLQNGKTLPNKAVKTIMENNPEALEYYVSGKKLCTSSNLFAYGVIINTLIFTSIGNNKETDEERMQALTTGLIIDGVFVVSAIIMSSIGKSKIKHSVELYNSSINKQVTSRLDFGLQENGIGLALRF